MIINIRAFGVDHLHSNTVILGFAEMLGILAGLLLILYTRRHWLWAGSVFSISGFITLFIWLIPTNIKEHRRIGFDMIFCICLKMANAMSMAILTTCTKEMVKLEKRPILMFSVTTYSRLWLLFAPFITALSIIHHLIPITVFAFLGILAGLFMTFLNNSFWDDDQPKIFDVPSTEIYRKNSQIIISRRQSIVSEELDEMPYVSIANILSSTCDIPAIVKN
ncbi:uncharacterized protein LOC129618333 [Condylostylus longicornis]|uniref:uncharacterized protein LOC129618333 n=1 Tax=Condylostylus longicornis TaxID=2530218 RepID=UPI00244DD62A|nr:uncharacterized protein LOC129618333 [Condylostylus longicornis]